MIECSKLELINRVIFGHLDAMTKRILSMDSSGDLFVNDYVSFTFLQRLPAVTFLKSTTDPRGLFEVIV